MGPYIKKIAKEVGKSEKDVEKLWTKAKGITGEEFGKSEDDFGSKEFAYTTAIVKKMLGIDESILDPSFFLESKKSAKDYLDEVVTSSAFSIGNVIPPEDKPEEDETEITTEEDEEDEEELEKKVEDIKEQLNIKDEDPDDDYLKILDSIINEE